MNKFPLNYFAKVVKYHRPKMDLTFIVIMIRPPPCSYLYLS